MTEGAKGVAAMIGTCTVWGMAPIYFKLLEHIPPLEVLAHRTLWSLIFFAAVLAAQRRLATLRGAFGSARGAAIVGVAAMFISINWFLFISAVQWGRITEASLGYFLLPLVSVVLGVAIFRETLDRVQGFAVALAVVALALLTWGLGVAPWIAVMMAMSFGLYGMVKKTVPTGPVVSVTAEVMVLSPFALAWLWFVHRGGGGYFGHDLSDSLLLALSGPLTAAPLILFSYAARRLRLATLGLMQYLNPTLQFLIATLIYQEAFTPWHAAAFTLIWLALVIYSLALWRQERALRRLVRSSATEAQRVM